MQSPSPMRGNPISSHSSNLTYFYSLRLLLAIVSVLCFALSMAQVFTNVFSKDGEYNWVRWGLWQYKWCPAAADTDSPLCVETDLPMNMCSEWEDRHRTIQAFSIILCVWSFICGVICFFDVLGISEIANLPAYTAVASMFVLCVLSLIQWSIIAASFEKDICDYGSLSDNGYRLSASFSLDLCIFFATIMTGVIYLFIRFIRPKWI